MQMVDFKQPLPTSRGGAAVARRAHNPKVAGSIPAPATTDFLAKAQYYSFFI